jgi:hypothetical protein
MTTSLICECGAGLVRDNSGRILIFPFSRPACGGASGTVLIAKKKHMTQSV